MNEKDNENEKEININLNIPEEFIPPEYVQKKVDEKIKEIDSALNFLGENGFALDAVFHASEIMDRMGGNICPGCCLKAAQAVLKAERPDLMEKIKRELERQKREGNTC